MQLRHRVRLVRVIPEESRSVLDTPFNCYMGISITNKNYQGDRFQALLKWVSQRCKHCVLIVVDSLQRLNIMIDKGLSEIESLKQSMLWGDVFADTLTAQI